MTLTQNQQEFKFLVQHTNQTLGPFDRDFIEAMVMAGVYARLYLNRTNQYAVDAFNRKVGQVNSLNDRVQLLINDFNKDVDAFNTELERVGTPIN